MLYHVNKTTGETGKCEAQKGRCPFGGTDEHFTSDMAARAHYENSMSTGALAPQKKDGRSVWGTWADLELYRDQIQPFSEVFVHPQGKIAFTSSRYHDRLTVMKDGKKASTSGKLEDLREGRGAWKLVKGPNDLVPSREEYEQAFESKPTVSLGDGRKVPLASILNDLEQANVSAGYPKTSPFDPRKASAISATAKHDAKVNRPAAILPLSERGNPFKLSEMKSGEKLRYWNSRDKNGKESSDSTFEVWGDRAGHYKAVVTSGDSVTELGGTSKFHHDQTGARMGDVWTMVGAFQPIENGAIIGKVPDVSMPIYTYK